MSPKWRQQKVGTLIQAELSKLLIEEFQNSSSGLITVTGVEMSSDLKTAYVYISFFNREQEKALFERLEKRKGFLRKSIASRVKLKYNPELIFSRDPTLDYEAKIDELIDHLRKNEK